VIALLLVIGLVVYAFIARLIVGAIVPRMSYANEPLGIMAGVWWPAGLPILLGAWLATRVTKRLE
jgi:hypothetical protein